MLAGPFAYAASRWRYRGRSAGRPAPPAAASAAAGWRLTGRALVRPVLRAGLPGAAIRAELARHGWRCERSLPTVSDTAVIMVRGPAGRSGVLKVAVGGAGPASLETEREILGRLGLDERLGGWRDLLPVPLRWGEAGGRGFLLTTRLPGQDGRRAPPGAAGGLTLAAFAAIAPLHRCGQTVAVVDGELLRSWLAEPAELLARVAGPGPAVERVAAAVRAGLAGRRVRLGWTHGDFHPGNVLVRGGQVAGIVDWDQARERDLVAADLAFWLLTVPAPGQRGELGAQVAARLRTGRCWRRSERRLLGTVAVDEADGADDPAFARGLLLLAWLRHVAGNLAKSDRYARSPLWSRRNVVPVLRQVGASDGLVAGQPPAGGGGQPPGGGGRAAEPGMVRP
jgi:Phosphotransferase enzyme family